MAGPENKAHIHLIVLASELGPNGLGETWTRLCSDKGQWNLRFSKRLYRERNLIERFFFELKHFRRVATRYDKPAENFLAMARFASVCLRLWAY